MSTAYTDDSQLRVGVLDVAVIVATAALVWAVFAAGATWPVRR